MKDKIKIISDGTSVNTKVSAVIDDKDYALSNIQSLSININNKDNSEAILNFAQPVVSVELDSINEVIGEAPMGLGTAISMNELSPSEAIEKDNMIEKQFKIDNKLTISKAIDKNKKFVGFKIKKVDPDFILTIHSLDDLLARLYDEEFNNVNS